MRNFVFSTIFIALSAIYPILLIGNDFSITEKDDIISYINKQDVVSYSSYKNDQQFIIDLKTRYNGLKNEENLDDLLRQQNYIEVLNHLWSEPGNAKRVAWLEKKVNEGHPILMFELGEEYYLQNPILSTYIMKSMPWLLAGARRTIVDADATSDKSVSAAVGFLLFSYQERVLTDVKTKFSETTIEKYLNENKKEFQKNNITVLRKVMTPFLDERLVDIPSPQWVFAHGMAAFTNEKNTIPEFRYNTIRSKTAEAFLKKADQLEKSL